MFSGADVAGKVGHTSGFPPHLRLFLWVVTCLFIFPFFFSLMAVCSVILAAFYVAV